MKRLKQFRLSKELSQEKLARLMDVTLSYYSQVEREIIPASRRFMQKFKNLYPEISIDEMFFSLTINKKVWCWWKYSKWGVSYEQLKKNALARGIISKRCLQRVKYQTSYNILMGKRYQLTKNYDVKAVIKFI